MIVGHPGAGKTYVASLLSQKTGAEKIDIDKLFDKNPFYAFSRSLYGKRLDRLLSGKNSWVIDGYHVGLMPDELFAKAELIIYLNLSKDELKKKIRARYKSKKAKGEFSHWQSTYINNLKNYGQIRFQDKALRKDVARIKDLVNSNARFIELKSRDEIEQFVHE